MKNLILTILILTLASCLNPDKSINPMYPNEEDVDLFSTQDESTGYEVTMTVVVTTNEFNYVVTNISLTDTGTRVTNIFTENADPYHDVCSTNTKYASVNFQGMYPSLSVTSDNFVMLRYSYDNPEVIVVTYLTFVTNNGIMNVMTDVGTDLGGAIYWMSGRKWTLVQKVFNNTYTYSNCVSNTYTYTTNYTTNYN